MTVKFNKKQPQLIFDALVSIESISEVMPIFQGLCGQVNFSKFTLFILLGLLFLISSPTEISAQERQEFKIDSVLTLLQKEDLGPRRRIASQLRLASLYKMAHPDVDSLINVSLEQAEANEFPFYIARSLRFRAKYRLYLNDTPEHILDDIARIKRISEYLDNELLPGWISNLSAQYYLQIGQPEKAGIFLDSLRLQVRNNPFNRDGIFHAVNGMYHHALKDYETAIAEFTLALEEPNAGVSYIYNELARLQFELEDYERAEFYANESIANGPENQIIPKIASYIILGDVNLSRRDTAEALGWFEKAEQLRKVPYYSNNYSALSKLIGIYDKWDPSKVDGLLSDISSYELTADFPKLLVAKGNIEVKKRDYRQAEKFCDQALNLAIQRKDYSTAILACDCLAIQFEAISAYQKSSKILQQKSLFQQQLFDQNKIKGLARSLAKFETEKDRALLVQAHEKDVQIQKEKIRKFQIAGFLAFLTLLIIVISWSKLRAKNKLINNQNKVISKALSEKEILLREIHHRVKNNLQLVSSLLTLQGRSIDDETAIQAINEGKSRVRSMALIHQDLYQKENLTNISVKTYLENLTQELFSTYRIDVDKLELEMDIQDLELDVDTLVPLGLIINELITNSLKYAFPDEKEGTLKVMLKEQNKKDLLLKVSDDGIGYDPMETRENSFGATLIAALSEQLGGELTTTSQDGTQVEILFVDYRAD